MAVQHITTDCDNDSLLVQVIPSGPACHLGFRTCFESSKEPSLSFLNTLVNVIAKRAQNADQSSYTNQLLASGIARCAQKVGEEAVEAVIAAVSENREELITETADLFFHLLVLLQVSCVSLYEILACLQERHNG